MLKLIYVANIGWFQSLKSLKLKKKVKPTSRKTTFFYWNFLSLFQQIKFGIFFFPIVNLTNFLLIKKINNFLISQNSKKENAAHKATVH
jgi:hypothetical protein